jgi:hypothetical protein
VAACHVSKGFCANSGNVSNIRRGVCRCIPSIEKLLVISKAFGVWQLRTYKFNIILLQFQKCEYVAGGPCLLLDTVYQTIPLLSHSKVVSMSL